MRDEAFRISFLLIAHSTSMLPLRTAHEIDLGGADIGVPGELAHLVHRGPVADGVVDRRFAQRVDADAAGSQPRRVDAGCLAVFLDQPPGRLAVQMPSRQPQAVGTQRAEEGAFLIVPDACPCQVGQERPRRVERDRAIPSNQLARLLKAEAR
jgi:hypothetical protein